MKKDLKVAKKLWIFVLAVFLASCSIANRRVTVTETTRPLLVGSVILNVVSPTNGSTNYDGYVRVSGTATAELGFGAGGVNATVDSGMAIRVGQENFDTNLLLPYGLHSLVFQAVDSYFNLSESITCSVFVETNSADSTPPVVSIQTPASNGMTLTNSAVFNGNVSDGRGVVGLEVKLGDNAWQSPLTFNLSGDGLSATWSVVYYGLPDTGGPPDNFYVRAWDAAGNTNSGTTRNFYFFNYADVTPPAISFTTPESNGIVYTNSVLISGTMSDDVGIAQAWIELTNSGNWLPLDVRGGTNGFSQTFSQLPSGSNYSVRVRARDGWTNETTNEVSFHFVNISGMDLFISEYADPGTGHSEDRYIEIYNGTGGLTDLSDYQLRLIKSGSTGDEMDWEADSRIFSDWSGANLANEDVVVVAFQEGSATIQSHADYYWDDAGGISGNDATWDGDDPVALFKTDNGTDWYPIDIIGYTYVVGSTEDPGEAFAVAGENKTADGVIVRKSSVWQGTTNWADSAGAMAFDSQWIVYKESDFGARLFELYSGCGAHPGNAADLVTPTFRSVSFSDVGGDSSDLAVTIDEDASFFAVVLADGSSAPTAIDVENNPESIGGFVSALDGGSRTAFTNTTFTLTNLSEGVSYDVWILAKDAAGNSQLEVHDLENTSMTNWTDSYVVFDFEDSVSYVRPISNSSWFTVDDFAVYNLSTGAGTVNQVAANDGNVASVASWGGTNGQKFYYFTVNYSGNFRPTAISWEDAVTSTPTNWALYTSADSYATELDGGSLTADVYTSHSVDLSALSDQASSFTIRISGYGGGGTYRMDNVVLTGQFMP